MPGPLNRILRRRTESGPGQSAPPGSARPRPPAQCASGLLCNPSRQFSAGPQVGLCLVVAPQPPVMVRDPDDVPKEAVKTARVDVRPGGGEMLPSELPDLCPRQPL